MEFETEMFDIHGVVVVRVDPLFRLSPIIIVNPMLLRFFEPFAIDAKRPIILGVCNLILVRFRTKVRYFERLLEIFKLRVAHVNVERVWLERSALRECVVWHDFYDNYTSMRRQSQSEDVLESMELLPHLIVTSYGPHVRNLKEGVIGINFARASE